MARLTRAESQARTRDRLIESGRTAFARTSYANASIEEIAEGAGYSKGAFYSNFTTKEALALEIVRQDTDQAVAATSRALAQAKGNPDLIMTNLTALATALSETPERYTLRAELMLHAVRSPGFAAAYQEQYRRHHDQITELTSLLFQHLNVPPVAHASILASAVLALAQGHALLRAVGDPSTFAESLRALLDSALQRARIGTSTAAAAPAPRRKQARAIKPRG